MASELSRQADGPISSSFERLRRDRGASVAIRALSEGRSLTFDDIGRAAEQLCRAFQVLRVQPGRPIALRVGNHSSFLPLLLACLRLHVVVLPLDGDSPLQEATRIAREYEAEWFVTLDDLVEDKAGGWLPLANGLRIRQLTDIARTREFGGAALLKLTSGSSAVPKAILCSEANLWHDGEQVVQAMGIRPDDVQLGAIPLSHSYALGNLVLPLLVHGARLVLRHGFIPPSFCRDVETCGVTVFPGVPFMFERMIGPMALERLPNPLRTLITAGAPIAATIVCQFKTRFGVKIHSFYGSSETGGIAYDVSEDVADPLTVGTAMPGVSISLAEIDRPPSSGAGRVRVCSRAVGGGYAGETPTALSPFAGEPSSPASSRSFLTEDIGRIDERGRLFLLGRISSAINVAGRKVQAEEVEQVLLAMPSVAEASVFAVPDATRGHRLVACVAPRIAGLTALALRQHCAHGLSPYKIPRDIIIVEALPRTARGKLDRRALEELAASGPLAPGRPERGSEK